MGLNRNWLIYKIAIVLSTICVVEAMDPEFNKEMQAINNKVAELKKKYEHINQVQGMLVVDATTAPLGLAVHGNDHIYLTTSGLIDCTGLVITDGVNTLLVHLVHDSRRDNMVKSCIQAMKNQPGAHKANIQLFAYYKADHRDAGKLAKEVVDLAEKLGVKHAAAIGVSSNENHLTINHRGQKFTQDLPNAKIYNPSDQVSEKEGLDDVIGESMMAFEEAKIKEVGGQHTKEIEKYLQLKRTHGMARRERDIQEAEQKLKEFLEQLKKESLDGIPEKADRIESELAQFGVNAEIERMKAIVSYMNFIGVVGAWTILPQIQQ